MPDQGDRAPGAPTESQLDEQRMRKALGLSSSNNAPPRQNRPQNTGQNTQQNVPRVPQQRADVARQRHRFVQDGGVPVVVLNHRPEEGNAFKERAVELERLLGLERTAHNETRRALTEANAAAQAAETRLAHADLAHQEALNIERRALASAQRALNEALTQLRSSSRRIRPAEPAPAPPAEPEAEASPEAELAPMSEAVVAAPPVVTESRDSTFSKKRGRPRTRPLPEPKPVRWWTPSYRAKTKA